MVSCVTTSKPLRHDVAAFQPDSSESPASFTSDHSNVLTPPHTTVQLREEPDAGKPQVRICEGKPNGLATRPLPNRNRPGVGDLRGLAKSLRRGYIPGRLCPRLRAHTRSMQQDYPEVQGKEKAGVERCVNGRESWLQIAVTNHTWVCHQEKL